MYLRAVHAELHIPSLRQFIIENPLGLLITSLQSPNFPTIQCTHLPWVLDVSDPQSETELGTLRGHLAKPNPHSKAMSEAVQHSTNSATNGELAEEVSVVFTGAVHHYVTPKFYVDTKPSTGKVVPTWNYSAVQAYGRAKIFFDSKAQATSDFLQKQIGDLSRHAETTVMGYTSSKGMKPWDVTDAPDRFIELLKKNITGIEIEITRLEGKFKMSQEMKGADRQGVVDGFEALQTESGRKMARTVQARGELKDLKTMKPIK